MSTPADIAMRNTEAPATSTPSQNHGNRHSTQPIDISQGIDIRHFLITPGLKCTFTNSGLGKFVRSHNNLEQSFFARDPTEELRYGPIIEQLRLKEDRPNKLLNQYHALIYSHRHKPEGLLYSDPRIKDIVDGVHAIQQNRRDAKLDEEKGLHRKMLSEKSTYGLLHTFKVLNMNDNGSTDEPVNLKVYTTMSNTLFYRGHQGGDYVMRYRTPANSSTGDDTAFDGRGNPIWPDSNSIFGSLGILDDIPLNAKGNFTYCGQVPRPLTQYIYRFSIVLVDVVVIIGTVIAYYRSINSCATHPQLEQILDDPAASRQRIGTLYTLWQETFEQREFPRTLCDDVQKCARVHEFAYLFGLLSRFREDTDALVTSCRPLVEILQQATGWHLFEMVDIEDCKRSKLAEHLLFQEQKFDNILVFEDDRIKDIHSLYSDPKYNCDKNHPRQQYRSFLIAESANKGLKAAQVLAEEPDETQSQLEIVVAADEDISAEAIPLVDDEDDDYETTTEFEACDPLDRDYVPL